MFFDFPKMGGSVMNNDYKQIQMIKDRSEVWAVGSADGGSHSFHVHLQSFSVIARRNIKESKTWIMFPREKQLFQDTLMIEPNIQFLCWIFSWKYGGRAMTHCHLLIHESNGMMLNLYINPNKNEKPSGVGITEPSNEVLEIIRKSSC